MALSFVTRWGVDVRNPEEQRGLHIATEALAVTVVAPVTLYIAANNPQMPRWQRGFLYAVAVGSVFVDGYLLAKWFDRA